MTFQRSDVRVQMSDWTARFADYELRKTDQATTAVIAPYRTSREDPGGNLAVIGSAWSRSMFGGLF